MKGRVLHLIETGGPGGAETVYLNLVKHLPSLGWDAVAVVPEPGWLEEQLRLSGAETIRVPSSSSFDLPYVRELRAVGRHHQVRLIQAHLLGSAVYGSIVARTLGLPVVCTFHGTSDFSHGGWLPKLKSWLIDRRQNRIVFVSDYLERRFRTFASLERASSVVIHNGVETRDSANHDDPGLGREELGLPEEGFLVGAVGNVRPAKAYPVLLQAAALLRACSEDWHFVVVGDTDVPAYDELLDLRSELGLERNVHFAGFRTDVRAVLGVLDAFCLSSTSEGFSLSTVQAMLSGVPVVATRSGGPEEIVTDRETGLLVEPGSAAALASALRSVREDPEAASRRATAAYDFARMEFDVSRMVARYGRLYEEVVDGG